MKRCLGALFSLPVVEALSFLERTERERFLARSVSDPYLILCGLPDLGALWYGWRKAIVYYVHVEAGLLLGFFEIITIQYGEALLPGLITVQNVKSSLVHSIRGHIQNIDPN